MRTYTEILRICLPLVVLTFGLLFANPGHPVNKRRVRAEGERPAFSNNPLVLNGNTLDYTLFSIFSRGKLMLVAGDPASKDAIKVPFHIYLRRDGFIVQKGASDSSRQIDTIEVATVLALAQHGDELVIEPARKADQSARRVINVKTPIWPLPVNWLPSRPGC